MNQPQYDEFKAQIINRCALYIADFLIDPSSAHKLAASLFDDAAKICATEGCNLISYVPAHLTRDGKPLPLLFMQ